MELTPLERNVLEVLGISEEQYEKEALEASGKTNTKKELIALDGRTEMMQVVDDFTLKQTSSLDGKTAMMQDIDDFTLQQVFALEARIAALESK